MSEPAELAGITAHLEAGTGWHPVSGRIETAPREELIARLRGIAAGCLGSDAFRQEAAEAVDQLSKGASGARVGHTWYYAVDNS